MPRKADLTDKVKLLIIIEITNGKTTLLITKVIDRQAELNCK